MAKSNKLEDKLLKEISLNEGLLTKIIARILKPKVDRVLKQYVKSLNDDPELQASLADLQKSRERVKDTLKDYCKKYPNSGYCR